LKIFLLIILAALIFVPPSLSGTIKGFNWNSNYRYFLTSMDTPEPPDGGFHSTNTTGCAWNDEDQSSDLGSGDLIGTTTHSICLVADYAGGNSAFPKVVITKVYVPKASPPLSVWLTNDHGDSWSPSGTVVVPYGNQNVYEFCYKDPVALRAGVFGWQALDDVWSLIPGTGGYGEIVNYTIHIQANKTVRNFYANYGVAFSAAPGEFQPLIQREAPGEVLCQ